MIKREFYLNKLIKYKNNDFVKIITGVRRCGKSTILLLFKEYLLEHGVDEQHIIELNFERYDTQQYIQIDQLIPYIKDQIRDKETHYILIDEAQEINEWAKAINTIRASFPVDLYC